MPQVRPWCPLFTLQHGPRPHRRPQRPPTHPVPVAMSLAADLARALDPVLVFEDAFGVPVLDWQREYLRATGPTVVLKGRQCGASTAAAALAIHAAVYEPNVN